MNPEHAPTDQPNNRAQVTLPGFARRGRFINFRWGVGDELVLFNSVRKDRQADVEDAAMEDLPEPREQQTIQTFSWDSIPEEFSRLDRKGAIAFASLQCLPENQLERVQSILQISQQLRQDLQLSIDMFERRLLYQESQAADVDQDYLDKLKAANAMWHLCEIVLLDQRVAMVAPFMEWVTEHFPRLSPEHFDDHAADVQQFGSESNAYWPLVFEYVLQGRPRKAQELILNHSDYRKARHRGNQVEASAFETIASLLGDMPLLENPGEAEPASRIEEAEFKTRWMQWNQAVCNACAKHPVLGGNNDQQSPGNDDLEQLVQLGGVLQGNLATILECLSTNGTWANLMAATLLFTEPSTRKNICGKLAEDCMKLISPDGEQFLLHVPQQMLLCVLNGNFMQAMQLLHSCVGDRWVDAHLAEILAHAQAIETVSLGFDCGPTPEAFLVAGCEVDMREYFVLQYVSQLGLGGRRTSHNTFSSKSWRLASTYLGALNRIIVFPTGVEMQLGRRYMEEIMERQDMVSEQSATKMVSACNAMGLHELGAKLCLLRAMRWWCNDGGHAKKKGNSFQGVSNALLWATKAGPGCARRFIDQIFKTGNAAALNTLVDHLGSSFQVAKGEQTLDSDMLALLSSYHELRVSLKSASKLLKVLPPDAAKLSDDINHHRKTAVACLCSLIESGTIPKSFWGSLIQQVLLWEPNSAMVRENPPQMTVQQATKLMRYLSELHISYEKDDFIGMKSGISVHDRTVMNFILAQGLAKAVLYKGCPDTQGQC